MRVPASVIRVALAGALAITCMTAMAASALAAYDHSTVEKAFQVTSPLCLEPQAEITDMAVDETAKVIYVACGTYVEKVIERYNYDGSPAPFPISRPYLSGNKIIEDPATPNGRVGQRVAVSNSPTNNGYVFTAEGNWIGASAYNVGIFRPTGDFAGILPQPNASTGLGDSTDDVAVGPGRRGLCLGQVPGAPGRQVQHRVQIDGKALPLPGFDHHQRRPQRGTRRRLGGKPLAAPRPAREQAEQIRSRSVQQRNQPRDLDRAVRDRRLSGLSLALLHRPDSGLRRLRGRPVQRRGDRQLGRRFAAVQLRQRQRTLI